MEWNGINTALEAQVSETRRSKGWIGGVKEKKISVPMLAAYGHDNSLEGLNP
jgi:hypothetical protein